jgi:hypothetical protein
MTDALAIAENLSRIRARIAEACARANRPANAVTLVAVSKTNPVEAVEAALAAGQMVFGETGASVHTVVVDGQVLVSTQGGSGVQCALRPW